LQGKISIRRKLTRLIVNGLRNFFKTAENNDRNTDFYAVNIQRGRDPWFGIDEECQRSIGLSIKELERDIQRVLRGNKGCFEGIYQNSDSMTFGWR
jgi:hypothetical protein